MNPELEALVKAFDAHLEQPEDKGRLEIFRSRLEDACERSGVSRDALEAAVKKLHRKMLKAAEKKPYTSAESLKKSRREQPAGMGDGIVDAFTPKRSEACVRSTGAAILTGARARSLCQTLGQ
jgi:hypothetical protein